MQPEAPQNPPEVSLLRRAWDALRRRPFLKLAALLLAIVFWAYNIASDPSLTIEKTIANVPVTVSSQDLETLRSRGLTVIDDLNNITVKLRVEVRQADYDSATASAFQPRLELASQINNAGPAQEVFFTAPRSSSGTILSFEPASIPVNVEEFKSRSRVPIVVEPRGNSGTPLWYTNVTTDPSSLSVSGPMSLVDQIQRAVVILPLNALSPSRPDDSLSAVLELQDASGNPISSSLLSIRADSIEVKDVRISLSVYPVKDVPVNAASAVTGLPAHGYVLRDVRVTPETVGVAASADVLAELETLYAANPLDISDMTESVTANLTLRSITDAAHMSLHTVTVEVDIGPATHVHAYNNMPVTVMGFDPTLTPKLSHEEMDVIIRGDYDEVQQLRASDVTLFVDASGLAAGVHMLDVQCIVNGTDAFTFEPELPRVTLTLTESGE